MTPYEQWVALLTLMRKEIRRYTRIWSQTLLPSAITMSLYFLIFGSLIGSRIGEMGGLSYMDQSLIHISEPTRPHYISYPVL